ncbi:MAG: lipopolysaccharide heptosyltransferase II [Pseudomonadota bacterium]
MSTTRVLVVAPNWIGDALMAQPLLARLRGKLAPGGRIEALAPPWVAPVLARMAEVDEVLEADLNHGRLQLGARWRLGRRLKARRYDEAVVLPNSWKSALVPFFAGIPVRTGYVGEFRYGLLNSNYKESKKPVSAPAHYARLAEAPGTEPAQPLPEPRLRTDPGRVAETLARFGIAKPYAALCPGAEYGPAKRWPYFDELSRQIGVSAVLLGSKNDLEASESIQGKNLIGQTSLDEAIDLISGAKFVVTNDSGLMHVAAALGTPQVALFGSSSPERTPPLSARARVLWLRPECSPCFERVCPLGHFRCMRELSVEKVLSEIGRLA